MRVFHNDPRRGSTLIEAMISLTILVSVVGSTYYATKRGSAAYEQEMAENAILTKTGRGLNKVLRELGGCGASSLSPTNPSAPAGADALQYRRPVGWTAGDVAWSPIQLLRFEVEEGELDNGLDDDGDGLIDEGVVVLIESPGMADESRSILLRGVRRLLEGEEDNLLDDNGNGLVDESGLCFERDGNELIVRLSVEGLGFEKTRIVKTVESSIQIRN